MNSKGIGIALAALVGLVGATIYVYRPADPASSAAPSNPWQALTRDRVDHVSIHRPSAAANQQHLEFEKASGAWRMTAPGAGPTEARAIEDFLDRLAEMKVVSIAARNTSSYGTFELDDAHATRVTLKNGSTTLLDVYVGVSLDSGTAVRVPGHNEVYRIDQMINSTVTRAPRDWRDRDITHLSRDSVRAVEWVNANGRFRFTRNGDTWSAAAGTVVDRLDTAKVNSLVDSVTNLRASDFGDASASTGITDGSPRVTIETEGDGGASSVSVRLGSNSGDQETFAKREGSDVVFVISRSQADAVNPAVSAFQAPLPQDGGADGGDAAAAAPAAPPMMPPGMQIPMPGGPGGPGGSPQIPPQIMEQIRRQMQQQAAGGGAH